jgi:FKBP-type peptidyl-prolyl cis-trans isomerase SlyD
MFPKVERALEGCGIGEKISVSLSPEEGFGAHDPGLTFTDDIDNVPPEFRHVGAQLEAQNSKGEQLTFVVTRIDDNKLTVDANHPLAGQTVHFDVTVSNIRDATAEELRSGDVGAGKQTIQ